MAGPPQKTNPVGVPCSIADCDRPTVARGLCNAHRLREDKGYTTTSPVRVFLYEDMERFLRGMPTPMQVPGACWEWMGARRKNGYGAVYSSTHQQAHRLAYELFMATVPKGMWVLHHCDNPPCCNPEHLFIGTPQDNAVDMVSKNRHGKYDPDAKQPRSSRRKPVTGSSSCDAVSEATAPS